MGAVAEWLRSRHQMHVAGTDARNAVADLAQAGKQLSDAEFAKGIATLELGDVQGHCAAWWGREWDRRAADWGLPRQPQF